MKANFKSMTNAVTNKASRQILLTRKHSPEIFFVAGAVGMVATVVLACRATLKLDEVLDRADKNTDRIDEIAKDEEEADKLVQLNKYQTALKITRLYTPAVVIGVLSMSALTGSHIVLRQRNTGLMAAYVAVDQGFKEYRKRVIGELGEDKDREFRFGFEEKTIGVETDEGVAEKTIRIVRPGTSVYARHFDETNQNFERVGRGVPNRTFIASQQQYANDLLIRRGHLFLNEVYEALGFEHTKAGAVVGWVRGKGDGYVSFGVYDNVFDGKAFVNGDVQEIMLDFNVCGVIYDMLAKV